MKKVLGVFVCVFVLGAIFLKQTLMTIPDSLTYLTSDVEKTQFLDRSGLPLNVSYQNYWNTYAQIPLHQVPILMQQMFIAIEDKNFYTHTGVDWLARFNALYMNLKSGQIKRGASTLSEQVVRMIHPRPRTFVSKFIEGIDAIRLENVFSKLDILEFYLNQVPYASNRRGIVQASQYYFNKTPDRLTVKEMVALVVLVRAPSSLDLYRFPEKIDRRLEIELAKLQEKGVITKEQFAQALEQKLRLQEPTLLVSAPHFLEYVRQNTFLEGAAIMTTLDAYVQDKVQSLTLGRLKELSYRNIHNAGVLVLETKTGNVIAWVVASLNNKASDYDAIQVLRQPASTQKPFLYALALEKGWRAWTNIKDAPYSKAVGQGVHHFKNYSRTYYGDVTLRQALGNSLNIPALKTVEFVGVQTYLNFLKKIGFAHLNKEAEFYREGLALGNGEVSLLELTKAYLMLANQGVLLPINVRLNAKITQKPEHVLKSTTTSLIGDILSDPLARMFEFGSDSVLNFSTQTAVKTGTSTDYRDSFALGYSPEYVVGVWFGNLDYEPMNEVTGANGAGLLLRSIFGYLNQSTDATAFSLNPLLKKINGKHEYYDPEISEVIVEENKDIFLSKPEHNIMLALNPRIPIEFQRYKFEVSYVLKGSSIQWFVDDQEIGISQEPSFFWTLQSGQHRIFAIVSSKEMGQIVTKTHTFFVR